MTRPVTDNFEPFTIESLDRIRLARIVDLSRPEEPVKRGRKAGPTGPRLDARARQVIAGLDPETQRILQQVLAKK